MEILTERLCLRPFRADDLPAFVAYRRLPEVARYQSWDAGYSMAEAEEFLAEQEPLEFGQPGAWVQLAVADRRTGALCGDCAMRVAGGESQGAEIGITIAPEYQGAGIAREALAAVVSRLFASGIHRIYAETDERNAAVHRLLERLGFRCEARLIDADWFKGEWCSLRIYAVLRREWKSEPASAP